LETAYIAHDTRAWEARTEQEFLEHYSGGGTIISSAHEKLVELIDKKFRPQDWNIYPVYFSDGFNWGEDDKKVIEILKRILPDINQYSYGEIDVERYWWLGALEEPDEFSRPGNYGQSLEEEFIDEEKVVFTELKSTDDAFEAFKEFFGKKN